MSKTGWAVNNVETGKRVRKIREANGLTQEALAEILEVTPTAVRGYESGEYGMSKEVLVKMREYFKVPIDYLLFGENENQTDVTTLLELAPDEDKMQVMMHLMAYFVMKKEGSMYDKELNDAAKRIKDIFGENTDK